MKFTIRKIIFGIIPHKVARACKKKISINYLGFGAAKKAVGNYLIEDASSQLLLYGLEGQVAKELIKGFEKCYEEYSLRPGFLRRYLLAVEDCIIEPLYGWGITAANNKLVFDSISNNTWIETYHPPYFKYKKNKGQAILLDEAVSINILKGGESNYWHFLHDILGQVTIALAHLPKDIPFLISRTLSERKYFQDALQISPVLSKLNWLIRDEHYYRVKKTWFVQPMPNSNEQFFKVRDLLQVNDSDKSKNRKIFLVRSDKRIRFIKNREEIESIAQRNGFEIVDTDQLSLQQQIKLFSETRWLVGIHGAGLTNVLFRKNAPFHLLELLPLDYLQPHYFWLSKGMGHEYDFLVGSISNIDTSFYLDAIHFEEKIKSFTTQPCSSPAVSSI